MVYTCEVNICNPNLCSEVKVSLAYGNIHSYVIRKTKSVGKESQQITIIRFLNDKYCYIFSSFVLWVQVLWISYMK